MNHSQNVFVRCIKISAKCSNVDEDPSLPRSFCKTLWTCKLEYRRTGLYATRDIGLYANSTEWLLYQAYRVCSLRMLRSTKISQPLKCTYMHCRPIRSQCPCLVVNVFIWIERYKYKYSADSNTEPKLFFYGGNSQGIPQLYAQCYAPVHFTLVHFYDAWYNLWLSPDALALEREAVTLPRTPALHFNDHNKIPTATLTMWGFCSYPDCDHGPLKTSCSNTRSLTLTLTLPLPLPLGEREGGERCALCQSISHYSATLVTVTYAHLHVLCPRTFVQTLVVVVSRRGQSFFVDNVHIIWWLCTRIY